MSYIDKGRYKVLLNAARYFAYTHGFVFDTATNLWFAREKHTKELEVFGSKLPKFKLGIKPDDQIKLINDYVRFRWKKFNVPYYEPNDYEISVMFTYIRDELNELSVEERREKYKLYKENCKKPVETAPTSQNLRDDIF